MASSLGPRKTGLATSIPRSTASSTPTSTFFRSSWFSRSSSLAVGKVGSGYVARVWSSVGFVDRMVVSEERF
jgi:hypothetical protein